MKKLEEKKKTKEEKHWKKYKEKGWNGTMIAMYCLIFVGLGAILFMGALAEKEMYRVLKDDDYLTDDGLPYRDMANATYTYPVAEIDELAESSNWLLAMGGVLMAASVILLVAMLGVMPEKKEIHSMLCRQWQEEKFAGKNGYEDMTYCPECGLKLSKLEKE